MAKIFEGKKKIIFIIAFLFLILIIILISRRNNSLSRTCFNHIQDTKEEGIDCGGVCAKACDVLEKLEILWTKIIPIENNKYHFLGLIKNPNALYGASQFKYQFQALDSVGKVIAEREGESFILPGEDKYLSEINIDIVGNVDKIDLKISDLIWQRFSAYKKPILVVIDKNLQNIHEGDFFLELSGGLINDSIYNLRTVSIDVVLFDQHDNAVALNQTYVGNIRSQERRDFKVFWKQNIPVQNIKKFDVRPETNIFQEENFVKDYNYEKVDVRYESER